MGEIIPLFPEANAGAMSGPWRGGERSILDDFIARLAQRMPWGIDVSTGVAEDGDPWIALCDVRTGEVLLHIARVGGRYMVLEPEGGLVEAGADLRDLLRRYQVAAGGQASAGWGSWPLPVSAAVSLLGLTLDLAEAGQAPDGRLDPPWTYAAGGMEGRGHPAEALLDLVVPRAEDAPPPAHPASAPTPPEPWGPLRETIGLVDLDPGWSVPRPAAEPQPGSGAGPQAPGDATPQGAGETLVGGPPDETITGGAGADSLVGGEGDDSLSGADGADTLDGGAGDDSLSGAAGADALDGGAGDDSLAGGEGDDSLSGAAGADALDGGAGNDSLRGDGAEDTADAEDGPRDGMGAFALAPRPGAVDDRRAGGGGGDAFSYGTGADTLAGGGGDDTLMGGAGRDSLFGGSGADSLVGGSGGDRLSGGAGRDTLAGGRGDDALWGGRCADSLEGGQGNDLLDGGAGRDTVAGGRGDDTLVLAAGDIVSGGGGADHFVLLPLAAETGPLPRILDFSVADDRLFLRIGPDREAEILVWGRGSGAAGEVLLDLDRDGAADPPGAGPAAAQALVEALAQVLQGPDGTEGSLLIDAADLLGGWLRLPDWA